MRFPLKATADSPAMFDNKILDALSRTHWVFVPGLYVPAIVILLWYNFSRVGVGVGATVGLFVAGYVVWTLTEYWIHRTIFHWVPDTSWGPRMHFFVHGVHHDWPNDPYRLVMPPSVSVILFFLFLGIFWLIFGRFVFAFQAGFTFGYIIYDLIHYYTHHAKPRVGWIKRLQQHHLSHHFHPKYENLRFSISMPIWDKVFRTQTVPRRAATAETAPEARTD
ncbi:MAG: fatty acid hydroxylase [Candidatus Zixiibacteriota bacterium]|nr:MAG: fatty acid hydroxylase [candidate division Zixibacteria bacterium]